MAQFSPGELVWLLPYNEVRRSNGITRSDWNRAERRNPHKVGLVLDRNNTLTFQNGYVRWPMEAFVSADPRKIKPVEVGDLL